MEHTSCLLCGSDRTRLLYHNHDLDISRCRTCGFVYAGPMRVSREETRLRYSDAYFWSEYLPANGITGDAIPLELYDARYRRALGLLRPHRRLGTLLEIGCGAGLFLKAAERDGWEVLGLEVMTAGVEFARSRLDLTVLDAAVEDADLPAGSFDVVVMFEVIEHLSNPGAELRRLLGLLRPGGCLALSTPNIRSLSRLFLGGSWSVLSPFEHLCYFSEHTLTAMLRSAGYTDVRHDRHHAGSGRYETLMPTHSFAPDSKRARVFQRFVDRLGPRSLHLIQALGLGDGLHCYTRRPVDEADTGVAAL